MKKAFMTIASMLLCVAFALSCWHGESSADDISEHAFLDLCRSGSADEINNAIKSGADPNTRHKYTTALMEAAEYNKNPKVVSILLDAGADVNARDDGGETALIRAASDQVPEVISILLDAGADVNARAKNTMTALMKAAWWNSNPKVVSILLDAGADVNAQTDNGYVALDYARAQNNSGAIKVLEAATGTTTSEPAAKKVEAAKEEKKFGAKTTTLFSAAQLEKLINEGKVPAYVGDKGEFSYNPEFSAIIVTGDGVRLRSQPNTKANIIDQLDKQMRGSIDYLGTWTHPDGTKWNIGLYDDWGYYPEPTPEEDKKIVFVSAQYSEAISKREYYDYSMATYDGGADAGGEDESGTKTQKNTASVTPFFKIPQDYAVNPFGAVNTWVGKDICIESNVSAMRYISNKPFIVLGRSGSETDWVNVMYIFDFSGNSNTDDITKLREGEKVKIKGNVSNINIEQKDSCFIVFLSNSRVVHDNDFGNLERESHVTQAISTYDLAEEFHANAAKFERKYKGNEIVIRGKIENISSKWNRDGGYTISFEEWVANRSNRIEIDLYLSGDDPILDQAETGAIITISGIVIKTDYKRIEMQRY